MAAPQTKFAQFSSSGVNPVGSRHLTTHASYIKELNTAASGLLDFGTITIDSKNYSPTKAVLFRAANMNGNTRIENMRFWLSARPQPIGTIYFNMKIMTPYQSGISLNEASGQAPTSVPSQNLFRTDGHPAISGITDSEVSRWIYLNIGSESETTTGKYGGNSSFKYRCTFDYL